MSSDTHDVPKMVGIYKKLFAALVIITALGIGIAFLRLPVWLAVAIAVGIIFLKGKVVLDAFKHLLAGRPALVITFTLTAILVAGLLLLPLLNHEGYIVGTQDISKQLQEQDKPAEAHHGD